MRNIRKSSRDFLGVGGEGGFDILVLRFAPIPLSSTATPPTFDLSDLKTRLDHPVTWNPEQGRSQNFSKGGSQRLLTRLSCRPPRPYQLKTRAVDETTLQKNKFKKSGLFNNGFYGQDIVMSFSPPEYCRMFAQKKAYQGGSRAPQDPTPPPPQLRPCRVPLLGLGLIVDRKDRLK